MISYETALSIAKKRKPEIDNGAEYENAFVFGSHADDNCIGPGPVAVRKEDGKCVPMMELLVRDGLGECLKEFEL